MKVYGIHVYSMSFIPDETRVQFISESLYLLLMPPVLVYADFVIWQCNLCICDHIHTVIANDGLQAIYTPVTENRVRL